MTRTYSLFFLCGLTLKNENQKLIRKYLESVNRTFEYSHVVIRTLFIQHFLMLYTHSELGECI